MEDDRKWPRQGYLSAEPMTSLEARMARERPQLLPGLERLKKLLGEDVFDKYIASLQNMTKNEDMLLLVTRNMMQRSHIERCCIAALKEAFAVERVKVVG